MIDCEYQEFPQGSHRHRIVFEFDKNALLQLSVRRNHNVFDVKNTKQGTCVHLSSEIVEWLHENIEGANVQKHAGRKLKNESTVKIKVSNLSGATVSNSDLSPTLCKTAVCFKNKEDALLFLMTWK